MFDGVRVIRGCVKPSDAHQTVALRGPIHAPSLPRRSMRRRETLMTGHAPARTGGAVLAGWNLHWLWVACIWMSIA